MLVSLLLVFGGLVLLVAGGEVLLRGAVGVATLLRLTPAVIGLTVVAAGTSVPELAVSGIAAWQGSTDIAVANVVGSNIFNILFILGLGAVVFPLSISGNTIKLEYPVLALVTFTYVVLSYDGSINRLDAILLLAIYPCFTAYMVKVVRTQMNAAELQEFRSEVQELTEPMAEGPRAWVSVALIVGGIALLVGGAHLTVTGAVQFARLFGISERVIGLTIVAAGTGLPEVVTSLVSSFRGRDDVAIGNVIGSNLFNILVTLGLTGLIDPLPVPQETVANDNWWMLGATVLLFPVIFTARRIVRWEGGSFLILYVMYVALLLSK